MSIGAWSRVAASAIAFRRKTPGVQTVRGKHRPEHGVELQEALRAKGYRTPVIVITAFPNETHRKRALDGGAVDFLSKPFDEASLIRCLTAAIKSPSQIDLPLT
jgi:FixJ family two-component response regulator